MKPKFTLKDALTFACFAAMVALFFFQARIALRPVGLQFDRPPIAYGYSDLSFSGYVYKDEGITPARAGTGVALSVNGAAPQTATTDANGYYEFTHLSIVEDDVVTVFVDGETMDGALVTKFNTTTLDRTMSGNNIYRDRLIIRSSGSNLSITTSDLQSADNVTDEDLDAVFTMNGDSLQLGNNKELFVWRHSTLTSTGDIHTHDVDIRGTATAGSNNLTASGSLGSSGSLTVNGTTRLTSVSPETIQLYGDSVKGNLTINNGLIEYWKFDDGSGANATGSVLGSGGSLLNMESQWVRSNTGTTLFFNPFALEFDGTNDYGAFENRLNIQSNEKRTFAGWFRRKGAATEDVILAKRTSSGASAAGYMLYIDDADDKLHFEVSDGTDEYRLSSTTTFTDQNWHHFAVSWSALSASGSTMYIDGSNNSPSRAGTFADIGAITNSTVFTFGASGNGGSPFVGTLDDMRIYSRVLTGSENASLAAGNVTTGSGVFTINRALDVNSDFNLVTGALDVTSDNHAVTIGGDMRIVGDFRTQSGTVTLDGTNQTIRGSAAFRHLVKTVTATSTLTLGSNTMQAVSGSLTVHGAVNNLLSLRATVVGVPSYINLEKPGGGQTLKHLDVKNSTASGVLLSCSTGCVDSGGNTNWAFLGDCGDGVVNTGEACDDGNSSNLDACLNTCVVATCGDGYVDATSETCDPPDGLNCLDNCQLRGLDAGVGATVRRSTASAGATTSFHARSAPPEGCGNALLEEDKGEECDKGARFNGSGTCSYDCKKLHCGDGKVTPHIGEDCEPNKVDGEFVVDECGVSCTIPITLNGEAHGGCRRMVLPPCETSGQSGTQSMNLSIATCGNGIVEGSEECDYGGICTGGAFDGSFWTDQNSAITCQNAGGTPEAQSGDGCTDLCTNEFCGDGVIQVKGKDNRPGTQDDEVCDNGSVCEHDSALPCVRDSDCSSVGGLCVYNVSKNRTCSSTCRTVTAHTAASTRGSQASAVAQSSVAFGRPAAPKKQTAPVCGNGMIDGNEECDDGFSNSDMQPNACRRDCTLFSCGDAVLDSGEECDQGAMNSDELPNSCRSNCRLPYCGDGVRDAHETCDGEQNCLANCTFAVRGGTCGNRVIEKGEQCDDGNTIPGDGCSRFCQLESLKSVQAQNAVWQPVAKKQIPTVNSFDAVVLQADVVIVNPIEIANAITFTDAYQRHSGCAKLLAKGQGKAAEAIRAAAVRQEIPIRKHIPVARSIYNTMPPQGVISGVELCTPLRVIQAALHPSAAVIQETSSASSSSAPRSSSSRALQKPRPLPLPRVPVVQTYGNFPLAQLQPLALTQPPAGETGPGAFVIVASGIAAGVGWMRRRRR